MTFSLDIWSLIAFGIGFWMLVDGLIVGAMPELMRRVMSQVREASIDELRFIGLVSAVIGVGIIDLIVGL